MASRPIGFVVCALWLAAAAIGLGLMLNYQNAAGRSGKTPAKWPAETALSLSVGRPTLVMFAHPCCPCTRASIEELNRLLAKTGGNVSAHIFFLQPAERHEEWSQTDLRRSASAIPGVTVHDDPEGVEARRFGAETSGFVVLYDTRGELLFKGGITAARGHVGDNPGANLITSLSTGETAALQRTPVYGCSLLNRHSASSEEIPYGKNDPIP